MVMVMMVVVVVSMLRMVGVMRMDLDDPASALAAALVGAGGGTHVLRLMLILITLGGERDRRRRQGDEPEEGGDTERQHRCVEDRGEIDETRMIRRRVVEKSDCKDTTWCPLIRRIDKDDDSKTQRDRRVPLRTSRRKASLSSAAARAAKQPVPLGNIVSVPNLAYTHGQLP